MRPKFTVSRKVAATKKLRLNIIIITLKRQFFLKSTRSQSCVPRSNVKISSVMDEH